MSAVTRATNTPRFSRTAPDERWMWRTSGSQTQHRALRGRRARGARGGDEVSANDANATAQMSEVDRPEPAVESVAKTAGLAPEWSGARHAPARFTVKRGRAELGAHPDAAPKDGEGAAELLGDLQAVLVADGIHGAHVPPYVGGMTPRRRERWPSLVVRAGAGHAPPPIDHAIARDVESLYAIRPGGCSSSRGREDWPSEA